MEVVMIHVAAALSALLNQKKNQWERIIIDRLKWDKTVVTTYWIDFQAIATLSFVKGAPLS